jgi:hypothetical protein
MDISLFGVHDGRVHNQILGPFEVLFEEFG